MYKSNANWDLLDTSESLRITRVRGAPIWGISELNVVVQYETFGGTHALSMWLATNMYRFQKQNGMYLVQF